ncbi:hypothetical protein NDU88_006309 [Pleurodeles waltl]|uniref:Uncharacterized protein n=1 Tax=Pleurodeles waltl TaxID=8319 RepID=A0AAV7WEC7_PLEWA|nr:hypothetical protein NDU88_006309 [Pleurodeles waltl]
MRVRTARRSQNPDVDLSITGGILKRHSMMRDAVLREVVWDGRKQCPVTKHVLASPSCNPSTRSTRLLDPDGPKQVQTRLPLVRRRT